MTRTLAVVKGVIVAAFVAVMMVLSAPAAMADCEQTPAVGEPNSGLAGKIDPVPIPTVNVDGKDVEDLAGPDPFDADSGATIYSEYGWGAYRMHSYDPPDMGVPGCLDNRALTSWDDRQATMMANLTAALGAWAVALTRLLFNPASLAILNPVVELVSEATTNRLFMVLFPVMVVVAALMMMRHAASGKVAATAKAGGWLVVIGMAATITAAWSLTLAPKVDAGVTGALAYAGGVVASPFEPGSGTGGSDETPTLPDVIGANLAQHVGYETWCSSHFGRNPAAAEAYCSDLFKAANYSRTEVAAIAADPSLAEDFAEAKEDAYTEAAESIEEEYPKAYEHLTGERADERMSLWVLALLSMVIAALILSIGLLMTFLALLFVRLYLAIFPAMALVAVLPGREVIVVKSFDYVLTKVVQSVAFCAVSLIWIAGGLGTLNSPSGAPMFMSFLLMLLGTYAMWRLIKHFQLSPLMRKAGWDKRKEDARHSTRDTPAPLASGRGSGAVPPAPAGPVPPQPAAPAAPTVTAAAPPRPSAAQYTRSMAVGAAQGAAVSVVTGGTATIPAAAFGAARGAASTYVAGRAAQRQAESLPYYPAEARRRPGQTAPAPAPVPAPPTPAALPPGAAPAPQTSTNLPAVAKGEKPTSPETKAPGVPLEGRVYTPKSATPQAPAPQVPGGATFAPVTPAATGAPRPVHNIYVPKAVK